MVTPRTYGGRWRPSASDESFDYRARQPRWPSFTLRMRTTTGKWRAVPAWAKTVCCGPTSIISAPSRSSATAGDYVVDIYPFPIPARMSNEVAAKMTPAQLAEAQRMARDWKPTK